MRQWAWLALGLALTASVARSAEPGKPLIDLARVGSTIPIGQRLGDIRGGFLCVPHGRIEWTSENAQFRGDNSWRDAFRQSLKAEDFRVVGTAGDLFETHSENPDLQVGALMTALHEDLCMPAVGVNGNTATKGSGSMAVEWQVYSVARGQVIGKVHTEHSATVPTASDGYRRLTRELFAANARDLAQSEAFARLVADQTTPASNAPAVTPSTLELALPPASQPISLADDAKGVVTIFVADALGSGVLISPDGYILTNQHVAGDTGRVRIRWPDGTDTVGEVVRADKRRDVALIKTTPPKVTPLAIRHTPVQLGETVYAIGTPREREFAGTLTRGVVSTVDRRMDGLRYIQSDVAITHGNSGGPLLDEKGWIVGLTDMTYEPGGVSQNINFFIPIDEALAALALTAAPVDSPQVAAAPPKAAVRKH